MKQYIKNPSSFEFWQYLTILLVLPSFLVPPSVEGGTESTALIVILHSPLELDCPAIGTPLPTIT